MSMPAWNRGSPSNGSSLMPNRLDIRPSLTGEPISVSADAFDGTVIETATVARQKKNRFATAMSSFQLQGPG